jgi:hypothetical protein
VIRCGCNMILHYFLIMRCEEGSSEEGGTKTVVEARQSSFETRRPVTQYRTQLLETSHGRCLQRVSD